MNDPSFQTNLITKIETELQHTIIDTSSPPQGMGSTVFLIKTDDQKQYAVKYGSTVTNDVVVLELIAKHNINIPVPKVFGHFVFEEIPVLILERIAYPLLDSIPIADMDKYIPSMIRQLRELHKITSNKPGSIDQGSTETWKNMILSRFDGRTSYLQWDEIATRQGLDKDIILNSVEKILNKIQKTELISTHYSLLHTDFNQRNLFVNPDTDEITGIIDWSEAMYGDPIYDFARVRMYIWHFNLKSQTLNSYYTALKLTLEERNYEEIYMLVRIIEYLAYYSEELNEFNTGRIKLHQDFLKNYNWEL